MKNYRRMTYKDRVKLESLYNTGKFTIRAIASVLGFAPSSICEELKHGYYNMLNSDWTETKRYSADRAQQHADFSITTKRPPLKIGNDYDFVELVEHLIVDKKKSPDEVVYLLRTEYKTKVKTQVCTTTLYSYIAQGFFPRITANILFFVGKRKRKNKTAQTEKKAPHGQSIDTRLEEINSRETFGHWEMDTVIGTKRKGETLIVLTERKTRYEIILRAKDKSALSTAQVLNYLERRYKKYFCKIFKSITVDNGTEFSCTELLEKSIRRKAPRTTLYYCHPYTSSERGSNENQNRFVRKFFPRGTPIKNYTDEYIQATQDYINNKYRKLLNYHTSAELFAVELANLNIL